MELGALSIQQKFRFEISEISRAQWNGTFRLHRPDPSHRAFGHFSCKLDTKQWYEGQQFCQMERDFSVGSTEMARSVKVDHLQRRSQIFRSDRTETVRSNLISNRNFGILGWMESVLGFWIPWVDSGFYTPGFWIRPAKISQISEFGCPYMGWILAITRSPWLRFLAKITQDVRITGKFDKSTDKISEPLIKLLSCPEESLLKQSF